MDGEYHGRMVAGLSLSSLVRQPFVRFVIVGASGVAVNLAVTWVLTEFVFTLEGYFYAYLIGTAANLLFNFYFFTIAIFETKTHHMRRLVAFFAYAAFITPVQAFIVKTLTPIVGLQYYLFVISGTILVLAVVNYFVFKSAIFRQ